MAAARETKTTPTERTRLITAGSIDETKLEINQSYGVSGEFRVRPDYWAHKVPEEVQMRFACNGMQGILIPRTPSDYDCLECNKVAVWEGVLEDSCCYQANSCISNQCVTCVAACTSHAIHYCLFPLELTVGLFCCASDLVVCVCDQCCNKKIQGLATYGYSRPSEQDMSDEYLEAKLALADKDLNKLFNITNGSIYATDRLVSKNQGREVVELAISYEKNDVSIEKRIQLLKFMWTRGVNLIGSCPVENIGFWGDQYNHQNVEMINLAINASYRHSTKVLKFLLSKLRRYPRLNVRELQEHVLEHFNLAMATPSPQNQILLKRIAQRLKILRDFGLLTDRANFSAELNEAADKAVDEDITASLIPFLIMMTRPSSNRNAFFSQPKSPLFDPKPFGIVFDFLDDGNRYKRYGIPDEESNIEDLFASSLSLNSMI